MTLEPTTIEEFQEAIRSCEFAIPIGAGTKSGLAAVSEIYQRISTLHLSGIVEYDPTEFTITALAGTPLREIEKALSEYGQYLPFDPPFATAGATIGGTVAAGLSGPGAFRFGPIRDFLIGIRFIDGDGRLISGGGKVVKNAAGFDLPKFLIGSLGRFGALAELTFKVFPKPPDHLTFGIAPSDLEHAIKLMSQLSGGPFDLEAIEFEPHARVLWGRLSGNRSALESRLRQIENSLALDRPLTISEPAEADYFWQRQLDFSWANPDQALAKIPLDPKVISELEPWTIGKNLRRSFSMAGNVAWVSGDPRTFDRLNDFGLTCLVIRDPAGSGQLRRGRIRKPDPVFLRLKNAFDPKGKFPLLFDEPPSSSMASDGPSPIDSRPDPD